MINHARTLLLNPASAGSVDDLFHEFVPAFQSLKLPTYLQLIRANLFGTDPDIEMLNYRSRIFMSLLHSTELQEFVLAYDPRITYDPNRTHPANVFGVQIQSLVEGNEDLVIVSGAPTSPDSVGRLRSEYDFDVLSPTSIQRTVYYPQIQMHILNLEFESGVSQQLELPGSGYSIRIRTADALNRWRLTVLRQPQWDIGQIVANLTQIGEPVLVSLFGTQNLEPWITFRNLWESHPSTPYKLGGLLLAYIARCEELRRG